MIEKILVKVVGVDINGNDVVFSVDVMPYIWNKMRLMKDASLNKAEWLRMAAGCVNSALFSENYEHNNNCAIHVQSQVRIDRDVIKVVDYQELENFVNNLTIKNYYAVENYIRKHSDKQKYLEEKKQNMIKLRDDIYNDDIVVSDKGSECLYGIESGDYFNIDSGECSHSYYSVEKIKKAGYFIKPVELNIAYDTNEIWFEGFTIDEIDDYFENCEVTKTSDIDGVLENISENMNQYYDEAGDDIDLEKLGKIMIDYFEKNKSKGSIVLELFEWNKKNKLRSYMVNEKRVVSKEKGYTKKHIIRNLDEYIDYISEIQKIYSDNFVQWYKLDEKILEQYNIDYSELFKMFEKIPIHKDLKEFFNHPNQENFEKIKKFFLTDEYNYNFS